MTRIDFYIHDSLNALAQNILMCRVTEKAWKNKHQVFIRCTDNVNVETMDELLWKFSDTSFVPHERQNESIESPVIIGEKVEEMKNSDVLVNLGIDVPNAVSKFHRVVEPAGYNEESRNEARERYRYYKDRGFPIFTHKVGLS